MNDAQIAHLLAKRDHLLTRRDRLYDSKRVARIEAQLATVEPGRNNEVDLALGRLCAMLEKYSPQTATLEEIERQQRIFEQLEAVRRDWLAIRGDTDI